MAEEEAKKKINFKKIALFGLGQIVLIGIGLGVGAFLIMHTQTHVEQVEDFSLMLCLNVFLNMNTTPRIIPTVTPA